MDDHCIVVQVEYHVMADTAIQAITRVMQNLDHTQQDLTPIAVTQLVLTLK